MVPLCHRQKKEKECAFSVLLDQALLPTAMEFVKDLCACATCGRLEMPCISVTLEVFELVVEYYRGNGLIHFYA